MPRLTLQAHLRHRRWREQGSFPTVPSQSQEPTGSLRSPGLKTRLRSLAPRLAGEAPQGCVLSWPRPWEELLGGRVAARVFPKLAQEPVLQPWQAGGGMPPRSWSAVLTPPPASTAKEQRYDAEGADCWTSSPEGLSMTWCDSSASVCLPT